MRVVCKQEFHGHFREGWNMLKHFAVETAKLDNMTPYNDEETNQPTDRCQLMPLQEATAAIIPWSCAEMSPLRPCATPARAQEQIASRSFASKHGIIQATLDMLKGNNSTSNIIQPIKVFGSFGFEWLSWEAFEGWCELENQTIEPLFWHRMASAFWRLLLGGSGFNWRSLKLHKLLSFFPDIMIL